METLYEFTCQQCKKVLLLPKKRFWRGTRKFCSNKCERNSRIHWCDFECKSCGLKKKVKWREINFGRGNTRKFCNKSCRDKYMGFQGRNKRGEIRVGEFWEKHKNDRCLICNRTRAEIKTRKYWFSSGMCLSCRRLKEVWYADSLDLLEVNRLRRRLINLVKGRPMPWASQTQSS